MNKNINNKPKTLGEWAKYFQKKDAEAFDGTYPDRQRILKEYLERTK